MCSTRSMQARISLTECARSKRSAFFIATSRTSRHACSCPLTLIMCSNAREPVSELLFLRLEIPPRRIVRWNFQRQPLGGREAVSLDPDQLTRIIAQEPHRADPQLAQNLYSDSVVPLIGLESEPFVGFDRVKPLVLQLVGANL